MALENALSQKLKDLHTRGKKMMKEEPGRASLRMTIVTGVEMPEEEHGIATLSLLVEMLPGEKRKTLNQLEKPGVRRKNLSHLEKLGERRRRHLSLQTHGAISQHKPAKEEAVGELNNLHITLYFVKFIIRY